MNKTLVHVSCNLCGGENTKLLYKIFEMRIVRCRDCGLVYVNPRPGKDVLIEIYDDNYFSNRAYRVNDEARYFGYSEYITDEKNIIRKFQKNIKIIERFTDVGNLLDIGCACGFFMNMAHSRGWQPLGIEPSKFASDYAKKRFNFNIHNGFLEDVRHPDGYFDAVTMWDVIEHLDDPLGSLSEVNRIMKKGGVLAIITPNIGSFPARLLGKRWLEMKRVKEHIYFFSYATLSKMLKKANFRIRYMHTSGKYMKLEDIVSELNFMHWPIAGKLARWMQDKRLSKKNFYINPGYKMAIYAEKIASI